MRFPLGAAFVLCFLLAIPLPVTASNCESSDAGSSWDTATDTSLASANPVTCDGTLTPGSDTADWYAFHFAELNVPNRFGMTLCSLGSSYGFIVSVQVRTEYEKLTGGGPFEVFYHDQPKGGCSNFVLGDDVLEKYDVDFESTIYIRVWLGACTDCSAVKSYRLTLSHAYET
jgi:hypothetical protein